MNNVGSIIDDLIDITDWKGESDDTEINIGTCNKEIVVRPKDGWNCIFKLPKDDRKHQIWSEMLASFVAGKLGWDAQCAGVAIKKDSSGNIIQVGSLLPYIMKSHENGGSERLNNGENLFLEADSQYYEHDKKIKGWVRGSGNTLPLLQAGVRNQIHRQYGIEKRQFLDFMSRMFAFDTLITCTDRHPENWGIITDENDSRKNRMAPFFDNASSLGCSESTDKIESAFGKDGNMAEVKNRLKRKFRHHVRLYGPAKKGATFQRVSKAFLDHYPEGRVAFEEAARLDIDEVDTLMTSIRKQFKLPEHYRLTKTRQRHIRVMLEIGKERIEMILKESS